MKELILLLVTALMDIMMMVLMIITVMSVTTDVKLVHHLNTTVLNVLKTDPMPQNVPVKTEWLKLMALVSLVTTNVKLVP